jgi:hypothetical protein
MQNRLITSSLRNYDYLIIFKLFLKIIIKQCSTDAFVLYIGKNKLAKNVCQLSLKPYIL